ncbi:hypothetical protein GCM10023097_63610 [Streptomyces collinus]
MEPASSPTTAINGNATTVTLLPRPLTVSPTQSRRKSGRLKTPPRGRGRADVSFLGFTGGIMP